jgi:hypothetical protein
MPTHDGLLLRTRRLQERVNALCTGSRVVLYGDIADSVQSSSSARSFPDAQLRSGDSEAPSAYTRRTLCEEAVSGKDSSGSIIWWCCNEEVPCQIHNG